METHCFFVMRDLIFYFFFRNLEINIMFQGLKYVGAFAKRRKTTVQCRHVYLSVRLSIRMMQLGSHWTDFHGI